VRHLTKGENLDLFDEWMSNVIGQVSDTVYRATLQNVWRQLKDRLNAGRDERTLPHLLGFARQIIFTLSWLVCGVLLSLDSQRDNDKVAREVARRWVLEGQGVPGEFAFTELIFQRSATAQDEQPTGRARTELDCRMVWNVDLPLDASLGYRAAKI
jgi:hypothetical protein